METKRVQAAVYPSGINLARKDRRGGLCATRAKEEELSTDATAILHASSVKD